MFEKSYGMKALYHIMGEINKKKCENCILSGLIRKLSGKIIRVLPDTDWPDTWLAGRIFG